MNIYNLTLLIVRMFCFTVSPIDKDRFKESYEAEMRQKDQELELDIPTQLETRQRKFKVDWKRCLKWRELRKAIKSYHMVGDEFFICLALQFLSLLYLGSKILVYSIYVRSDEELATYLDRSLYFPRLFATHKGAEVFSNYSLSLLTYCFSIRILALFRLIRNSLINFEGHHRDWTISQVNVSYAVIHNWKLKDWIPLLSICLRHFRQCKTNKRVGELHRRLGAKLIGDLDKFSDKYLCYRCNVIDFSECYKEVKFLSTEAQVDKSFNRWYLAQPLHRVDPFEFGLMSVSWILALIVISSSLILVLLILTLEELSLTVVPEHSQKSLLEILSYLPQFLSEPRFLIRLLDIFLFILVQLPNQFDSGTFYWDAGITISRARKVNNRLCLDMEMCLRKAATSGERLERQGVSNQNRIGGAIIVLNDRLVNECQKSKRSPLDCRQNTSAGDDEEDLEASILKNIQLTRLIQREFYDIKRVHSAYLNIMMIGGGLCLAFSLSTLQRSMAPISLQCCFVITAIGASAPLLFVSIFSIFVDRQVSGRYLYSEGS